MTGTWIYDNITLTSCDNAEVKKTVLYAVTVACFLVACAPIHPSNPTPPSTYSPGALTLKSGASVTVNSIVLTLGSNCVLRVASQPSGEILWSATLDASVTAPCSNPQARFLENGNLVVMGDVGGSQVTAWQTHTVGSSLLSLSSSAPYLLISNSDASSAWGAVGDLTFEHLAPSLLKSLDAYGEPYSDKVQQSSNLAIASGDRVDNFRSVLGSEVQVLVKGPVPNDQVLQLAARSAGQSVTDYFASAITQAQGYGTLVLPKDNYAFELPAGWDPSSPDYSLAHWAIQGSADLVIDGQGSTLSFAAPCLGIEISGSHRIVLKNFVIDWPELLMASLGTVQKVSQDLQGNYSMEVLVDGAYTSAIDTSTFVEAINAWDRDAGHFSLPNANDDESIGGDPATQAQYVSYDSAKKTFTLGDFLPQNFVVGESVILRHFAGEGTAINIDSSEDVAVENVTVYASPGSAIKFSMGRGLRVTHMTITRKPGALVSLDGDAIHVRDNRGDLIVENSEIGFQGDDGINLNAAMLPVPSNQIGQSLYRVQDWDPSPWAQANTTAAFSADFKLLGFSSVTSISSDANQNFSVGLAQPLPPQSAFLADLTYGGGRYLIRNNRFTFNRARGLLAQTANGLIEGNTFMGQTLYAVYVVASPFWGEGPGAQNVTIANNSISNTGNFTSNGNVLGAFVVATEDLGADTIPGADPIHASLVISGNHIESVPGPGFFLSTAANVAFVGNTTSDTNQSSATVTSYGTASTNSAVVITNAHNVFLSGNSFSGAAGRVSIDSGSTSGITMN